MNNPYRFQNLSGLAPMTWTNDLHFIATGMTWDYDMRRMSTGDNRRDFGPGNSGTQFSAKIGTSFGELHLTEPYPDNSYHFAFGGNLRLLDLRSVPDPNFSGQYYNADRSISCKIIDANLPYLRDERFDGILRYSKVALDDNKLEEVVALTPDAIGKLSIKHVTPLGNCSGELNIIHPDGRKTPMHKYYPAK